VDPLHKLPPVLLQPWPPVSTTSLTSCRSDSSANDVAGAQP
jgi:hypothetical protein